jgi:protein-tyrosine phosphatase
LIDIHSHFLFGMDDGAGTFEESLAMLRLAAEHGTTAIVGTPHSNLKYRFEPEVIAERLARLSEAVAGVIQLYSGCDFHLSYDNIQDALENPHKYTINGGNYLLVEFSDLLIFRNTQEIFARLAASGMIPVITHPERNSLLRQRLDQIQTWVASGATVQVTAQSLTGRFGRRAEDFSRELLNRGLVHFIASDGHDCKHRPPRMDEARAWLTENYGEPVATALCVTNPGAAVASEPLEPVISAVDPGSRKWYEFWR